MTHRLASLCFLAACTTGSGPEMLEGFSPPAPAANEVQYLSPIVRDIQPGEDRIICSYLDAYLDEDADIGRIAGYNSLGSHHIILYTTTLAQAPNTHECKEDEMVFLSLVGGTGGDAAQSAESTLPEGLVRRVRGGSQLVIQTHWLNTTEEPLDGQAAFNVRYEPVSAAKTPTDFMAVMNTEFSVTPGTTHASVDCMFDKPVNIWELAGHQHSLGSHVRIGFTPAGGEEKVLFDKDWQQEWSFNPQFIDFTKEPLYVKPGDRLHVDCDWNNPGTETLRFPSEMCGSVAQFYPSESQLVCFNGSWLGN